MDDATIEALRIISEGMKTITARLVEVQNATSALVSLNFDLWRLLRDADVITEPAILERLKETRAVLTLIQGHDQAASQVAELIESLQQTARRPVRVVPTAPAQAPNQETAERMRRLLESFVPKGPKN